MDIRLVLEKTVSPCKLICFGIFIFYSIKSILLISKGLFRSPVKCETRSASMRVGITDKMFEMYASQFYNSSLISRASGWVKFYNVVANNTMEGGLNQCHLFDRKPLWAKL